MSKFVGLIITIVVAFILITRIKVVQDHQRLAKFAFGKFKRFLGPGVVFTMPVTIDDYVRLSVGAQGTLLSSSVGEFNTRQFPVTLEGDIVAGDPIRIKDFQSERILVIRDPNPIRSVKCEKCGHTMSV